MKADTRWQDNADGTRVIFANKTWTGQSVQYSVGRVITVEDVVKADRGLVLFKFTLQDKTGKTTALYQPTLIENYILNKQ